MKIEFDTDKNVSDGLIMLAIGLYIFCLLCLFGCNIGRYMENKYPVHQDVAEKR